MFIWPWYLKTKYAVTVDSWWALDYSGVRTQVLQQQLSKVKSQDVKVGVTSEEATAS